MLGSERERERCVYLVIVVPEDKIWRLRAKLYHTGEIDGGTLVDVHVRTSQHLGLRLCWGKNNTLHSVGGDERHTSLDMS